jgi:Uma2 family endonuclease
MDVVQASDVVRGDKNPPEVEAAFAAAPPEVTAEIIDGQLYTSPRPGRVHARGSSRLGMVIGGAFDLGESGPGGWVILDEPELHLGARPDKLVPDLAGWRRERMPDAVGDPGSAAHYDLVPDWICEILSDRTERLDRGKKMRIYRRERVPFLWLLNPAQQTLEVYRLERHQWTLVDTHEGADKVRAEPFEAVEMDLGVLWAR